MAEYIEREQTVRTAITAITDIMGFTDSITLVKIAARIREVPSADVVEVVHGRLTGDSYDCSVCGRWMYELCDGDSDLVTGVEHEIKWCPFCGAKMDGDKNE